MICDQTITTKERKELFDAIAKADIVRRDYGVCVVSSCRYKKENQ